MIRFLLFLPVRAAWSFCSFKSLVIVRNPEGAVLSWLLLVGEPDGIIVRRTNDLQL